MTIQIEADWLEDPRTRRVLEALESRQPNGSRFVGGCIRNSLIGAPVDDIDIATQLRPEDTMQALEDHGIRAIATGIEHGTITGVLDHKPFEITTLRRDVETDGRRAVVAFTQDWTQDAQRRDFRLNALYADLSGTVFDPVGGGVEDALAGRVIFIGDADERLREDYLRILRFFRFNAWYGQALDRSGLEACARHKEALAGIARERIWKEFHRMLAAPNPSASLDAMYETGVLQVVLGGDWGGVHRTERLVGMEGELGLEPDALRRFMTIIPGQPDHIEKLVERLRLSNAERDRLLAWADPDLPAIGTSEGSELRAALYRFGPVALRDRALVEYARSGAPVSREFLTACRSWDRPVMPVRGQDLLEAGLSGPAIGAALERLEQAWIASDFRLDKQALLARLDTES